MSLNSYYIKLEQLKERCAQSKMLLLHNKEANYDYITNKKKTWQIPIADTDEIDFILSTEFEHFKPIEKYEGMYSSSKGIIECELVYNPIPLKKNHLDELNFQIYNKRNNDWIIFPNEINMPNISIGHASKEFIVWRCTTPSANSINLRHENIITIRLENTSNNSNESAIKMIEFYAAGALLQLNEKYGINIRLMLHYPWLQKLIYSKLPKPELESVERVPVINAINLFWQGMMAPTLSQKYLGFYHVLEYYFPECTKKYILEELKNSLPENFSFNSNDIAELIYKNLTSKKIIKLYKEEEQLKFTIKYSITEKDLKHFLQENLLSREYITNTNSDFSTLIKSKNIIAEVIKMIYKIRNKIVHSKENFGENFINPFSIDEANLIRYVDLLKYVALKLLKTMDRQFTN